MQRTSQNLLDSDHNEIGTSEVGSKGENFT